jgi:hypothetical protein
MCSPANFADYTGLSDWDVVFLLCIGLKLYQLCSFLTTESTRRKPTS